MNELELNAGRQPGLQNNDDEQDRERREYVEQRLRQLREWHEWMLDVRNFHSI